MPQPDCITASTFYRVLGVTPQASPDQIRCAYRELCKRYHPDTTTYAPEIAGEKLRQVQEAYKILQDPIYRAAYDLSLLSQKTPPTFSSKEDDGLPTERPLSGGEIFALFILVATLIVCLGLAFIIALLRESP